MLEEEGIVSEWKHPEDGPWVTLSGWRSFSIHRGMESPFHDMWPELVWKVA